MNNRFILAVIASTFIPACSSSSDAPAAPPASNRDLAVSAFTAVFVDKDPNAVDTYFAPSFIRHDPSAKADGAAAFKTDLAGPLGHARWTSFRVLSQGDLVVLHDAYDDFPTPGARTIAFDLLRFEGGKIAEHWTCGQQDPGHYASGHSMVDGATQSDPTADTAASADVVVTPGKGFVPVVIIGGALPRLADFLAPTFAQHDPLIADGLMGLGVGFSQPPLSTIRDLAIPESLSENDFVFTRSKGTLTYDAEKANSPNNPTVYCDLFRVAGGKIVEHWDVIQLDPNSSSIDAVNTNGAGHTLWD